MMQNRYLEYLRKKYKESIWDFFLSDRKKLIYGKGMQAKYVYEICRLLDIHIEAFVSTGEGAFPGCEEDEKNYTIDTLPKEYTEAEVLIAMSEKWNKEITELLSERGFHHVCAVSEWEPLNGLFQTHFFKYMMTRTNGEVRKANQRGIVRFCEGLEVNIRLEDYTRDGLLEKIYEEHLENALFHVYEGDNWKGTIEFGDLFVCEEDWTAYLYSEKKIFKETVFQCCYDFFTQYPWRTFMPVYWEDKTVACMAWLERPDSRTVFESHCRWIDNLREVEKKYVKLFFSEIGEVCLHGMNEMSYYLYSILKTTDIPYHIDGEYWRFLGDDIYEAEINKPRPATRFQPLDVYGEEQGEFSKGIENERYYEKEKIYWNYEWLNTLGKMLCVQMADRMTQKLVQNGVAAFLIRFPESMHLQKITDEEEFDCERDVYMHNIHFHKSYGRFEKIYEPASIKKYFAGTQQKGRFYRTRQNVAEWRVTEEERKKHIYLIGPCVTAQTDLPTERTIVARLQKKADMVQPGEYVVCAVSIDMSMQFQVMDKVVNSIDFWNGDICLFLYVINDYKSRYEISLKELFDSRRERWFSNTPIHLNEIGSGKVAEYIFEKCVRNHLGKNVKNDIAVYASELDEKEKKGIDQYVHQYKSHICTEKGEIGCIVMNCNPFTYGHEYLIEKARKQVAWLYIFVVEEDKSYFSFADRMEIVRENTKKYGNVTVLPSGDMILSMQTLPSYFMKEINQETEVDASKDLRLFGLGIAPAFGITMRFAGEEPEDKVTEQYNREMEKRLSHYGIKFMEIPRKKIGNETISASKVRKLLEEGNCEEIRKYVSVAIFALLEKLGYMKRQGE